MKVAELQFMKRDYVLLFRGQKSITRIRGRIPLSNQACSSGWRRKPLRGCAQKRFRAGLDQAERFLQHYIAGEFPSVDRLQRQRILRWSIRNITSLPDHLLDVTHSLRIAARSPRMAADDEAFIFVAWCANLSGASLRPEAGLQSVRFQGLPAILRQAAHPGGYLLGDIRRWVIGLKSNTMCL